MNANHRVPLFPFQKTAPGQEKGIASETAEIQARISFSFLDELATETSLKREDIGFCDRCQTKNFRKEYFLGKDCALAKEKGLAFG
jgi:hypothetical protein